VTGTLDSAIYDSQTIAGLPHSSTLSKSAPREHAKERVVVAGHISCGMCCLDVANMPRPQFNSQQAVNGDKDIMTADTGPRSYDITPLI
jgi:hypothetical protein